MTGNQGDGLVGGFVERVYIYTTRDKYNKLEDGYVLQQMSWGKALGNYTDGHKSVVKRLQRLAELGLDRDSKCFRPSLTVLTVAAHVFGFMNRVMN